MDKERSFGSGVWVGFAGLLLLELGIVTIADHYKKDYRERMYVSSPKDIIENWTYPAFIAGYMATKDDENTDAGEQYHIWFEKEYTIAYNRMTRRNK